MNKIAHNVTREIAPATGRHSSSITGIGLSGEEGFSGRDVLRVESGEM